MGRELNKNERDRNSGPITDRGRQNQASGMPPKWHAPQISILAFSFTAMAGTSGVNVDATINYS
jgi:hypothetical protein